MLQKLKPVDFDKVFHIMEQSFPEDEYRTYEEQQALLKNPAYYIYTLNDNADIKAFVAIWEFDEIIFIEHLAVNPEFRNEGLGSLILQEMIKRINKLICLEVELPEDEMKRRRIGFYERNGFHFNEYEYIQPSISNGRNPVPLRIMTSGRTVTEEEFTCIKDLLYTEVYKVEKAIRDLDVVCEGEMIYVKEVSELKEKLQDVDDNTLLGWIDRTNRVRIRKFWGRTGVFASRKEAFTDAFDREDYTTSIWRYAQKAEQGLENGVELHVAPLGTDVEKIENAVLLENVSDLKKLISFIKEGTVFATDENFELGRKITPYIRLWLYETEGKKLLLLKE